MRVEVVLGDVLEYPADVLISTANPWLNMSGGVNGAILVRGGQSIQSELRHYLSAAGVKSLKAGTVVQTSSGTLPFKHILHAIAIDPFYDSNPTLIRTTLATAFNLARELGARTISMPTLATGYGHLHIVDFASAFAETVQQDWNPLELVRVVVRSDENATLLRNALRPPEQSSI